MRDHPSISDTLNPFCGSLSEIPMILEHLFNLPIEDSRAANYFGTIVNYFVS